MRQCELSEIFSVSNEISECLIKCQNLMEEGTELNLQQKRCLNVKVLDKLLCTTYEVERDIIYRNLLRMITENIVNNNDNECYAYVLCSMRKIIGNLNFGRNRELEAKKINLLLETFIILFNEGKKFFDTSEVPLLLEQLVISSFGYLLRPLQLQVYGAILHGFVSGTERMISFGCCYHVVARILQDISQENSVITDEDSLQSIWVEKQLYFKLLLAIFTYYKESQDSIEPKTNKEFMTLLDSNFSIILAGVLQYLHKSNDELHADALKAGLSLLSELVMFDERFQNLSMKSSSYMEKLFNCFRISVDELNTPQAFESRQALTLASICTESLAILAESAPLSFFHFGRFNKFMLNTFKNCLIRDPPLTHLVSAPVQRILCALVRYTDKYDAQLFAEIEEYLSHMNIDEYCSEEHISNIILIITFLIALLSSSRRDWPLQEDNHNANEFQLQTCQNIDVLWDSVISVVLSLCAKVTNSEIICDSHFPSMDQRALLLRVVFDLLICITETSWTKLNFQFKYHLPTVSKLVLLALEKEYYKYNAEILISLGRLILLEDETDGSLLCSTLLQPVHRNKDFYRVLSLQSMLCTSLEAMKQLTRIIYLAVYEQNEDLNVVELQVQEMYVNVRRILTQHNSSAVPQLILQWCEKSGILQRQQVSGLGPEEKSGSSIIILLYILTCKSIEEVVTAPEAVIRHCVIDIPVLSTILSVVSSIDLVLANASWRRLVSTSIRESDAGNMCLPSPMYAAACLLYCYSTSLEGTSELWPDLDGTLDDLICFWRTSANLDVLIQKTLEGTVEAVHQIAQSCKLLKPYGEQNQTFMQSTLNFSTLSNFDTLLRSILALFHLFWSVRDERSKTSSACSFFFDWVLIRNFLLLMKEDFILFLLNQDAVQSSVWIELLLCITFNMLLLVTTLRMTEWKNADNFYKIKSNFQSSSESYDNCLRMTLNIVQFIAAHSAYRKLHSVILCNVLLLLGGLLLCDALQCERQSKENCILW